MKHTIKVHVRGTDETTKDTAALLTQLIGPEIKAQQARQEQAKLRVGQYV